jgi:hypothetical protein
MNTTWLATACCFALLPLEAFADNPALHLRDRIEMLCNPGDEDNLIRLLDQECPLGGAPYNRDLQQPGTPIVKIVLRPEDVQDQVLIAMQRLPKLREVTVWYPSPANQLNPQQVKRLTALRQVEKLWLGDVQLGVPEVKALAAMPRLRDLKLFKCQLATDALKELARSPQLKSLVVYDCRGVTDEGVKQLSSLKGLQSLDLCNTAVTDSTLAELAGWPNLRSLELNGTAITNAGLEELVKSTRSALQYLSLSNCDRVTVDGIRRLKAALPECKIVGQSDKD